jgi:hypothetical protein
MDDIKAVGAREHLLEFWNGIFGGNLGTLGFLLEEGIDVETGEGLLRLAQALAAFCFWRH